uniref:Uncharacterized protein n=1 Tax=Culex tarsalis TaxID=7177 RepID=A0A1Q3EW71_CULTA
MGAVENPTAEAGRYFGEDLYDYPVCFRCVRWSPFMVFLEDNRQAKKFRSYENGMQLFCPQCCPRQDEFEKRFPGERLFREESILNDRQLMALLGQFLYEHPVNHSFAALDRIIITENAKLQPYKKLAKQALPLSRKLVPLMGLFPAMHRMANRKFASFRKMRSAVCRKAAEITEGYMNLSETEHSQLQDNFDVLVDRTPMHVKISSQQQQQQRQRAVMPPPVPPVRPSVDEPAAYETVSSLVDLSFSSSVSHVEVLRLDPGSDDEAQESSPESSLGLSSQEPSQLRNALRPDSQDVAPPSSQDVSVPSADEIVRAGTQSSSQSLQLSSQDVSNPNERLAVLRKSPGFTVRSRVDSTDSDSSTESVATTNRKRSLDLSASDRSFSPASTVAPVPSPNDGQQAGPSNKRARNDIPINPTPAQFVRNPTGRMPRLKGA